MSNLYWETATPDLVHKSLTDTLLTLELNKDEEYKRYGDYYDGRQAVIEPYFQKRHRETAERFHDRPKLSWPICRPIAEAHGEALAKGVQVTCADQAMNEWWTEIENYNDLSAFWKKASNIISVYGSCGVRPFIHDDGSPDAKIEFEAFPPDCMKFVYERNSAGRSVKRPIAAYIITGYSIENGMVFPWPVTDEMKHQYRIAQRVEYISPTRWIVWLDGKITHESPWGDRWMPAEDGSNPFGVVMASLFNGLETHEDFLGQSDIGLAVYDAQNVNEIWSDLIYMFRMYVPWLVVKTDSEDSRKAFKSGIGAALMLNTQEEATFVQGSVDWSGVMEPLRIALEITYSNAKIPVAAIGLSHVFGRQVDTVSGIAKAMEWKPVVSHATAKRPPFTRGIKDMVRKAARIAANPKPFGQGKTALASKLDTPVIVDYSDEIIPVSQAEDLERIAKEHVSGFLSTFQALKDYHKWDDQRAAQEMDMIRAESRHRLVKAGFRDIVDAVRERETLNIKTNPREIAETLFAAAKVPSFESDDGDET